MCVELIRDNQAKTLNFTILAIKVIQVLKSEHALKMFFTYFFLECGNKRLF